MLGEILAHGEGLPPLTLEGGVDPLAQTVIEIPDLGRHHRRRGSARAKAGIAATLVVLLAVIGTAVAIGSHSGPKDRQPPLADATTPVLSGVSTTSDDGTPTPTPSTPTPTPTPTPGTPTPTPTPTPTSSSSTSQATTSRPTPSTRPTTPKSTTPPPPPPTSSTPSTPPTTPTPTPPPYTISVVVTGVQTSYDNVCPPPSSPVTLRVSVTVKGTLATPITIQYNWFTKGRKDSDPSTQTMTFSAPGTQTPRAVHAENYWINGTINDFVGVTWSLARPTVGPVNTSNEVPITITCTGVIQ